MQPWPSPCRPPNVAAQPPSSGFRPAAQQRTGGHSPPQPGTQRLGRGATLCVTPRQTCPQPRGFGRNLRSKTRWFTGFCNSHQVSHFATFFIDARAEISVAESRSDTTGRRLARRASGGRATHATLLLLGAIRAGVRSCAKPGPAPPSPLLEQAVGCGLGRQPRAPCHVGRRAPDDLFQRVRGSPCLAIFDNDPSAGSPTETLLRLLLPLNDKVQRTSRDVAGRKPPTSPRSEHFTGPFNR